MFKPERIALSLNPDIPNNTGYQGSSDLTQIHKSIKTKGPL